MDLLRFGPVVRRVAASFARHAGAWRYGSFEDLVQVGWLALARGLDGYRPEFGTTAETFAALLVWRAICTALGRARRACGLPSRDLPDRGHRDFRDFYAALGRLNPERRQLLDWRYGLSGPALTLRELAAMLGVSRQTVLTAERQAVEELRRRLG